MATTNRPQLQTLIEGETYKAILLNGIPGMVIPYHHNTGEALLMVNEGKALLRMADGEHTQVCPGKRGNIKDTAMGEKRQSHH
ncbi:MAG: hypothetical protein KDD31_05395 [Muricauda sp.]|nr:hypothetical protein [Allomuricauda sp.]